jgi:ketosteroid isomerase-like protein
VGDSGLERNKDVVRQQLAAMERVDGPAQGALMTDDVRWWVPQSAEQAAHIPRPLDGRAAVVKLLESAPTLFSEAHWTIDHLVAEDDIVVAAAHMQGRTASGNDYLNQYVFVYRFVDGLIAEIWENLDTAYVFEKVR